MGAGQNNTFMFNTQDQVLPSLFLPAPWEAEEKSQRTQHEDAAEFA